MNRILELRNIHKAYDGVPIIKGLNLSIEEGDFISIMGVSGCGKTTLLNIIGLLDLNYKGNILYKGNDINMIDELRNKAFGFIFQSYNLLPDFNVLENIIMPKLLRTYFREKKQLERQALHLLEEIGLADKALKKPIYLSGGEKQRISIARAIFNDPDVILADEPTGNLDNKTADIIYGMICKLNKESNKTIILVTHNLEHAKKANKNYQLKDGQLEGISNIYSIYD